MKRFILALLLTLAIATWCSFAFAASAGTCTQSTREYTGGYVVITFACTGDPSDGSIPDMAISAANMAYVEGTHYLDNVRAYPTAGGTAPDAADVFILDANGEDYLGSEDAGTTANKGANLIHATLPKSAIPCSANAGSLFHFPIINTLTLRVANQATASANYTIELTFVR